MNSYEAGESVGFVGIKQAQFRLTLALIANDSSQIRYWTDRVRNVTLIDEGRLGNNNVDAALERAQENIEYAIQKAAQYAEMVRRDY